MLPLRGRDRPTALTPTRLNDHERRGERVGPVGAGAAVPAHATQLHDADSRSAERLILR